MTSLEIAQQAVKALDEKKAADIKLIKIRDISVLADYFVIATGTSSTHVKALADEVDFKLKEQGTEPAHTEGYRSNSWILLDYRSVVVHIFTPESRSYYDLDRLWRDGEDIGLSDLLQ